MRLDPAHLVTFALVVSEGGVHNAARRLHLTQPAVSNQLRKLQDQIGMPLYQRAGRGLALTGAGRALYVEAQRLAETLERAQSLADSLSAAETGLVRIRASQTPGAYVLPPLLASFRRQAPGIDIELSSHNSQEVLQRLDQTDLAFIESERAVPLPAGWRALPLLSDAIVAVVRNDHPLATAPAVSLSRLCAETLIWREQGSALREQVAQAFAAAGLQPRTGIRLAGVAAIKEAVRQGLGIGFASALALRHDRGPLRGVALDPPLVRQILLLTPEAPTAAAARLIAHIREQIGRSTAPGRI